MRNNNVTEDWQLYENGKLYNQRIEPNYYDTVNANIDFFAGNQWRNSSSTTLEKPVFNIIKRVTAFFVAQLTSNRVKAVVAPLAYTAEGDEHTEGAEIATSEIGNLFEKMKMDDNMRKCYFNAAQMGDVAFHLYFDPNKKPYRGDMGMGVKGEICGEVVLGTNVFFGNSNTTEIEKQPYIIISGRDTVKNLKQEAKLYRSQENEVQQDYLYNYEAGDTSKIEVEGDKSGKALYIIKYYKDASTGTIKASKSTQNTYIFKDIDTGLTQYPVSWLVWEEQINQYHGRALITGIIPNQIFINKMFAMVMYNLMMTAFPKAIYNGDAISSWNNEIGQAIKITGLGPEASVHNAATYLNPGNMSSQITQTIDMAMQYTKETLGISDAVLGNINPTNTSAIIAVQKSSAVPLENVKHNGYQFIENLVNILLDMMGTYYGTRPIFKEGENSEKVMQMYDFSQLKNLWLSTRVEVGESSYWSESLVSQTLDNLLMQNRIEFVDYLKRIPGSFIPEKQELIDKLEKAILQQQQPMEQPQVDNAVQQPDYEQMAKFFESLPKEEQQRLQALPPDQMEQELNQMMQQQQG